MPSKSLPPIGLKWRFIQGLFRYYLSFMDRRKEEYHVRRCFNSSHRVFNARRSSCDYSPDRQIK